MATTDYVELARQLETIAEEMLGVSGLGDGSPGPVWGGCLPHYGFHAYLITGGRIGVVVSDMLFLVHEDRLEPVVGISDWHTQQTVNALYEDWDSFIADVAAFRMTL